MTVQDCSRPAPYGPSLLVAAAFLLSPSAWAGEATSEITFEANPQEVWDAIGPFCAIAEWYPGVESCTEETISGDTHRRLVTADGAQFLEKLLDHDDTSMSYSYTIEEGPLPVSDYRATLQVGSLDGKTRVSWSGTFEAKGTSEEEAISVVSGIYDAGLEAIRTRLSN